MLSEDSSAVKATPGAWFDGGRVYRREIRGERKGGKQSSREGNEPRHELWRLICIDREHNELVFKKVSHTWSKVERNAFLVSLDEAQRLRHEGLLTAEVDDVRPQFMSESDADLKSKSPKALALRRNGKLDDEARVQAMAKWLTDRDSDYRAIEPLVYGQTNAEEEWMLVRAYSPRYCSRTVATFAKSTGRSQLSIKRLLHRYAWFGMEENAMLKLDALKGATGPLSRIDARKPGPKDSAERIGGERYAIRPRNEQDLGKFLYALIHYWADLHLSLKAAYERMKKTLYIATNQMGKHLVRETLIPSERAFRYAAKTLIVVHNLAERRAGHKDAMEIAPRRGYDTDLAADVGAVFDIDGTPFNRELVCRFKVRKKRINIGKAYAVLVFDRRSKKCVGWHVYLGSENWKEGYRLALFCAITSKAERLKWLRIHAPDAWPEGEDIRPCYVYVDGGPGASKSGRAALRRLRIDFYRAPPDTPYWKPTVEGGLGHLQAAQAQRPGGYERSGAAVEKDARRIAKLHAKATVWEFERALVLDIMHYNAKVQRSARLLDEMKKDGAMPIANDIYSWGVRTMGGVGHRRLPAAEAYEHLLEHKTVELTVDGVRLLNSRYQSDQMLRHFRVYGRCRIVVRYDPLRPRVVYWRTPEGLLDAVTRNRESERQNGLASERDMEMHRLHVLAATQIDARAGAKSAKKNHLTNRQRALMLEDAEETREPVRSAPAKSESKLRELEAAQMLQSRGYDQAEKFLPLRPATPPAAPRHLGLSAANSPPSPSGSVVPLKRSRSSVLFEQLRGEHAGGEEGQN